MIYLAIGIIAIGAYALIVMVDEALSLVEKETPKRIEGPHFAGQKGYGHDITDLMAETYRYENRQVWE